MAKQEKTKITAGEVVKAYVEERPSLFVYFINGLINVNALARKIKMESGSDKNEGALIVALHRLAEEVTSGYMGRKYGEKTIQKFLVDTEVNVYSNYAVAVFEGKSEVAADAKISFGKKTIAMGKKKDLEKVRHGALYYKDDLAVVEFVHPEGAEDVPGIVFRIYWKFFEKGISIIETFSAWNVTYIVVNREDLKKVTETFL
jgi:hypothetical protein